jgi:hypothetical protein
MPTRSGFSRIHAVGQASRLSLALNIWLETKVSPPPPHLLKSGSFFKMETGATPVLRRLALGWQPFLLHGFGLVGLKKRWRGWENRVAFPRGFGRRQPPAALARRCCGEKAAEGCRRPRRWRAIRRPRSFRRLRCFTNAPGRHPLSAHGNCFFTPPESPWPRRNFPCG